jgi:hypothetical protein
MKWSASCFALISPLVLVASVAAQLPMARLGSVFPPGAKQGGTADVTILGTDLDGVTALRFSHPGITSKPAASPGKFTISVAANVPPGLYDVRAAGRYGLSSARAFSVGDRDELIKSGGANELSKAMEVPLGKVVSGKCDAGKFDFFKFTAKKGQRLLIDCWADRIDSKMDATLAIYNEAGVEIDSNRDTNRRDPLLDFSPPADGVYIVKIYDFLYGGGNDYFYRLSISDGPYIDAIFPPIGKPGSSSKYTVYGRNLPGGVPVAGVTIGRKPIEKLEVTIALPAGGDQLTLGSTIEPREAGLDGFEYRLKSPKGVSNPILIGFSNDTIVAEVEPNALDKPQPVKVPCEIVGQFGAGRDQDWYTFDAKKGDEFWIEVISHRLGVPAAPFVILQRIDKDDKGKVTMKEVKAMDGAMPNIGGTEFNTAADDSAYHLKVPSDGGYRILVRDLYGNSGGGPKMVYRLAIRHLTGDYRLVALPLVPKHSKNKDKTQAAITLLRKGGTAVMKVVAFRRNGFNGEIQVRAEGLPPGVTSAPMTIAAGANSTPVVFVATDTAKEWSGPIKITGTAKVDGKDVSHVARGGALLWGVDKKKGGRIQARLTREVVLSVSGDESAPVLIEVGEGKVWVDSRGGTLQIPVKVTRRGNFKAELKLAASGLSSKEIKPGKLTIKGDKTDGKLTVDLKGVKKSIGTYTFFLTAEAQFQYARNAEGAKKIAEKSKLANAAAKQAADAVKPLQAAASKVTKAVTDAANRLKAAQQKLAQGEVAAKATAQKAMADAKVASDAANKAKQGADKKLAEAQAQKKPADALKPLQAAVANATKAVTDAANKSKATLQKLAAAATAAKATAQKAVADAKTASDAAIKAKPDADKKLAQAQAKSKAAEAMKKSLAGQAKKAADAAKPKKMEFALASTPVTIKITSAPIELAKIAPPAPLKQGSKIEVPIKITRLYNYKDQVEVRANPPKGVSGLKIIKVIIAKEKGEAKLVVEAAANATPGDHKFKVEVVAKYGGQSLVVSQSIPLKIQKTAKKK